MTNKEEQVLPQITDETRISLIKNYITTDSGWKILALSIMNSTNPNAKEDAYGLLKQIAGDIKINLLGIKLADRLVDQLDYYIALNRLTQEK